MTRHRSFRRGAFQFPPTKTCIGGEISTSGTRMFRKNIPWYRRRENTFKQLMFLTMNLKLLRANPMYLTI